MDFPIDGLVDYLISLAINHTKVEYLALSLFNVHVESAGQVRYIVLNKGTKLLPSPEITLKGALDENIIRILSPEIYGAIQSSRMRRKEMEGGNHITECISIILTSKPEEGAIINLSLGLKDSTNLKKQAIYIESHPFPHYARGPSLLNLSSNEIQLDSRLKLHLTAKLAIYLPFSFILIDGQGDIFFPVYPLSFTLHPLNGVRRDG